MADLPTLRPTAARPELILRWYAEGRYGHETLSRAMAQGAARYPGSRVVFHSAGGTRVSTLAEMHEASTRIAGAFHALGLRQGDVIAVQVPNWLEGLLTIQAAVHLGAVVVPIIHIYGPREVSFILRSSGAKAFVMPQRWRNIDYLERVARTDLAQVERVIVIGETAPPGGVTWAQLLALATDDFPRSAAHPDDACALIYTSGSTSDPKGVIHTHNSLTATERMYAAVDGDTASMVTLAPWPAGHIGSLLNLFRLHLTGSSTVLMDTWNAEEALGLVLEHGCNQTTGTPYFLATLLDAADAAGQRLAGFQRYLVGGASVPRSLIERADAHGIPACRVYGSSEGGTVAVGLPTDPLEKRAGTEGRPGPGVQVRIVDDAGREVPTGQDGEIAILSPQMFLGYNDAALNADAFTEDGWFLTGDVGRLDAQGHLTLTDRKKDIIIRGGENISSKEVEEVLASHPAVLESAVTAMPDAAMGEKVCAFIVARDGAALDLEEVRSHFLKAGIAKQKTPERIVLVDGFPRTSAGKIKKFELRQRLRSG